jgi:hypothetical protein
MRAPIAKILPLGKITPALGRSIHKHTQFHPISYSPHNLRRLASLFAALAGRTGQTLRRGGTSRRGWPVRTSPFIRHRLQGASRNSARRDAPARLAGRRPKAARSGAPAGAAKPRDECDRPAIARDWNAADKKFLIAIALHNQKKLIAGSRVVCTRAAGCGTRLVPLGCEADCRGEKRGRHEPPAGPIVRVWARCTSRANNRQPNQPIRDLVKRTLRSNV